MAIKVKHFIVKHKGAKIGIRASHADCLRMIAQEIRLSQTRVNDYTIVEVLDVDAHLGAVEAI